jgi:hypothetical protein
MQTTDWLATNPVARTSGQRIADAKRVSGFSTINQGCEHRPAMVVDSANLCTPGSIREERIGIKREPSGAYPASAV